MNERNMPYFGLQVSNMSEEYMSENDLVSGVYITGVEQQSPAEEANLVVGDIVTMIGNHTIRDVNDYSEVLSSYDVGDEAVITINRIFAQNNKERKIKVTLTEQVR